MTAHPDLDTRLREGLRAAAERVPPAGPPPDARAGDGADPGLDLPAPGTPGGSRRRTGAAVVAAAAVTVVVVGGAVLTRPDDEDEGSDVATEVTSEPSTTDTTAAPPGPTGVLGDDAGRHTAPVAGAAVITGDQLVTYGPDGQPGDTVSLAPLTSVQAAVPDLRGGWIVCGSPPAPTSSGSGYVLVPDEPDGAEPSATTTTVPLGDDAVGEVWNEDAEAMTDAQLEELEESIRERAAEAAAALPDAGSTRVIPNAYRVKVGEEPVALGVNVYCLADSLSVTEVGGQPVLFYVSPATFSGRGFDLVTGDDAPLAIDVGNAGLGDVAVGGGRLAVLGDDGGLTLWDLATGEEVAAGPIDLPVRPADATSGPFTEDLELSPDGTTLAALVSDGSAALDLVVLDLASGAELLRTTSAGSIEGNELSFDGTSVAVGNFYEGSQVKVVDVATGAERTIDAHGVVP